MDGGSQCVATLPAGLSLMARGCSPRSQATPAAKQSRVGDVPARTIDGQRPPHQGPHRPREQIALDALLAAAHAAPAVAASAPDATEAFLAEALDDANKAFKSTEAWVIDQMAAYEKKFSQLSRSMELGMERAAVAHGTDRELKLEKLQRMRVQAELLTERSERLAADLERCADDVRSTATALAKYRRQQREPRSLFEQ